MLIVGLLSIWVERKQNGPAEELTASTPRCNGFQSAVPNRVET